MEQILKERIGEELEKQGLSLAELSRVAKVPYRTLQDIMAEKRAARITTVQLIARGLGVSPATLLGGMEPQPEKAPDGAEKKLRLLELIVGITDESEIDDLLTHVEDVLGIDPPSDLSLSP